MKLSLLALCSIALAHTSATLPAEQQVLKVKTLKATLEIPFAAQTTILQIKEAIERDEGIPTAQQVLVKNEGWMLALPPKKLTVTLDDSQTCRSYDLQNNNELDLYIRIRS